MTEVQDGSIIHICSRERACGAALVETTRLPLLRDVAKPIWRDRGFSSFGGSDVGDPRDARGPLLKKA